MALEFLSRGSADAVGIETLDDVVLSAPTEQVLGQLKSSIASNNPLANGAVGLWKALAIWADAISNGEVNQDRTSFQLLFSGEVRPGLAADLGSATLPLDVDSCIRRLQMEPSKPSEQAAPYVRRVRAHGNDVLRALVSRLQVVGGQNTGVLHRQIAARLLLPADVSGDRVVEDLIGWIKVSVQRAWEEGRPAWIRQTHFNMRLYAAVEKHRRRRVRELPARELVCDAADISRHRADCFVRQLEIIDADPDILEDAILDFIRHNQERLRLTREGDTEDSDWMEFDDRLVEHWKPIFRKHSLAGEKPRRAGHTTYSDVQGHRESLSGVPTTEPYLTRGAFHRLANVIRVGWHPRFKDLCKAFVGRP